MSSNPPEISQITRNIHPNSLANLKKFEPGNRANPGGRGKDNAKITNAYDRLLNFTDEEFEAFTPTNKAERIAYQRITEACKVETNFALPAAKEITDRTEGKPDKNINLNISIDIRAVQVEALLLMYANLTREQVIERGISQVDAIYAVTDGEGRREVILAQLDESDEELGGYWGAAEEAVKGK